MIDRYTIKIGPAMSQKELEKALHEDAKLSYLPSERAGKVRARLEFIGDFEDVRAIQRLLKELAAKETQP